METLLRRVFSRYQVVKRQTANWEYIRSRKQKLINKNNEQENAKRIEYTYNVGDKVLLRTGTENKYGPHTVLKVNNNGTVRIQKGAVTETVNIQRITPYVDSNSF